MNLKTLKKLGLDKPVEAKVESGFVGDINGVKIYNESYYYSMNWILEQIEDKFGPIYNQEFVRDLHTTINRMYMKYDDFSFSTLENDFYDSIQEANDFNKIEFNYAGSNWKIEWLNEALHNGDYEKQIALGVGNVFSIVPISKVEDIELKMNDTTVKLGDEVFNIFKGTTFEESKKVDMLLDSNKYDELSINNYLLKPETEKEIVKIPDIIEKLEMEIKYFKEQYPKLDKGYHRDKELDRILFVLERSMANNTMDNLEKDLKEQALNYLSEDIDDVDTYLPYLGFNIIKQNSVDERNYTLYPENTVRAYQISDTLFASNLQERILDELGEQEIYLNNNKEIDYPQTEWRLLEAGIDKVIRDYIENSDIEKEKLIDKDDNLTKLGILEVKKELAFDLEKDELVKELEQEIEKEIENLEQEI